MGGNVIEEKSFKFAIRIVNLYKYLEWVKRIRIRFCDSLLPTYFVKILVNPKGFTASLPHLCEKYFITKFSDLK